MNVELWKLQDSGEMETEQRAVLAMRASGGRIRRRSVAGSSLLDPNAPHSQRVEHYVVAKEKWAVGHRKVSSLRLRLRARQDAQDTRLSLQERKELVTSLSDYEQREYLARIEEFDRDKRAEAAKVAQ